jgi:hypothetical protein
MSLTDTKLHFADEERPYKNIAPETTDNMLKGSSPVPNNLIFVSSKNEAFINLNLKR